MLKINLLFSKLTGWGFLISLLGDSAFSYPTGQSGTSSLMEWTTCSLKMVSQTTHLEM